MADFNVRSDSVDVEQVMEQIRARIREKRGVDYTEQQIRELAEVKLEKFLDPRGVRSDLLDQFRKLQAAQPYTVPLYPFENSTLFDSHRPIVRFFRKLFQPILKLVFNANALSQSLHQQAEINRQTVERLERLETPLYYELLHNLVVEFTRATIEVKNTKMRVESLASRLEFNERRARALESVVVYKADEAMAASDRSADRRSSDRATSDRGSSDRGAPDSGGRFQPDHRANRPGDARFKPEPALSGATNSGGTLSSAPPIARTEGAPAPGSTSSFPGEGPGQRSRRRRRRRGRRGGASAVATMGGASENAGAPPQGTSQDVHDDAAEEGTSAESASNIEDARETRPEPLESPFGSLSHPAEPQAAPAEDTRPRPPEPRVAPDTPDADGQ